jgi:alkylation response protein AidB-like acyl-CoA dehydrogenase
MSLTNSPSVETYKAYASRTLDSARELGPKIRAAADEIEQGRRLPMHLVREMQQTGMFRMAMPRPWGGPWIFSLRCDGVAQDLGSSRPGPAWAGA